MVNYIIKMDVFLYQNLKKETQFKIFFILSQMEHIVKEQIGKIKRPLNAHTNKNNFS